MSFKEFETRTLIKKLESTCFYSRICNLWKIAEEQIHPFQIGNCFQGSFHSINVLDNLSKIINCSATALSDLEIYILCCSAIFHDIDKAFFDYEKKIKLKKLHGVESADFISNNYNHFKFGLEREEAHSIANIIRYHGDRAIPKNLPDCSINNPSDFSKYGLVHFVNLAAIFKLADMMDTDYKRISDPILELNFPNKQKINNPKILARKIIHNIKITRNKIKVSHYYPIDSFQKYQTLIIAVDMMNQELVKSRAETILKSLSLPYKFELIENLPSEELSLMKLINARKIISYFNNEYRLTLNNLNDESEKKLLEIYNSNSKHFEFSNWELEQMGKNYKKLYSKVTAKSIDKIREKNKNLFGFCIDKFHMERIYKIDGSIKCSIKYQGLKKCKYMPLTSFSHKGEEKARKAKIIPGSSDIEEKLHNKKIYIYRDPDKKGEFDFVFPDLFGSSNIEKLEDSYIAKNAWCIKKNKFKKMYPSYDDYKENFSVNIIYPICKIVLVFKFPESYNNINPKCIYRFNKKEVEIEFKKNRKRNQYTFKNIQQDIIDSSQKQCPNYKVSWDIPD